MLILFDCEILSPLLVILSSFLKYILMKKNDSIENQEWLRKLYSEMLRIRMIEEELVRRYSEQEMRCPVHFSIGQEAVAVGVCQALGKKDSVFNIHCCRNYTRGGRRSFRQQIKKVLCSGSYVFWGCSH